MHIERSAAGGALAGDRAYARAGVEAKERVHLVVDAGVVGAVEEVKRFRCKNYVHSLAELVLPSQAHIEIVVIGSDPGIARRAERPFIGNVVVAIVCSADQQIEW